MCQPIETITLPCSGCGQWLNQCVCGLFHYGPYNIKDIYFDGYGDPILIPRDRIANKD